MDLTEEQHKLITDRIAADQQFALLPCVWFDHNSRSCLFYEKRPDACRRFEIGSELCRLSRCDIGLPG